MFTLLAAPFAGAATGDRSDPMAQRYARALAFAPWNVGAALQNAAINAQWSQDGKLLWYVLKRADNHELVVREADSGRIRVAAPIVSALAGWAKKGGSPIDADSLWNADPLLLSPSGDFELTFGKQRIRCPANGTDCTAVEGGVAPAPGDVVSPDRRHAAFTRSYNLWLRDLTDGSEHQVTRDGTREFPYASPTEQFRAIMLGMPGPPQLPATVMWSPDSRRLVTVRLDQRRIPDFTIVEQVPPDALLPRVHQFKYNFLTQPERVTQQLYLVDVPTGSMREVDLPPAKLTVDSAVLLKNLWWRADGKEFAVAIFDLSDRHADLFKINAATAATTRVFRESADYRVRIYSELGPAPAVHLLRNGDLIWFSERDGFGHLHLIDGKTGNAKRVLTPGPSAVHRLLHVDEDRGIVYYSAGGNTTGPDPYRTSVFAVRVDGGSPKLLTKENAIHEVVSQMIGVEPPLPAYRRGFSPDGGRFISTHSTLGEPEVTVLRDASGKVIAELSRATLAPALAVMRRRAPEKFSVPAPAGDEALHGVLFFPSDFDSSKKYPVIDAIYNGQQVVEHPRTFSTALVGFAGAQALAELGCIVAVMDGRGTPLRSAAFLDAAGRSRDQVESIGDHVHALRRLAADRPYLDLERVGVTGYSNGGYAALRAMLAFPDFFKVGVSVNGSHDLRKYIPHGGENWIQKQDDQTFETALAFAANQDFAANLRGQLLFIVGGMDTNVPLANTLGVVQALIDHGKDFELALVPRMGHGFEQDRFAVRKQWSFFARHLLGVAAPTDGAEWSPDP